MYIDTVNQSINQPITWQWFHELCLMACQQKRVIFVQSSQRGKPAQKVKDSQREGMQMFQLHNNSKRNNINARRHWKTVLYKMAQKPVNL